MRILLVYNPTAGDDGPNVDALVALLTDSGHAVSAQSVKEDDWAAALSTDVDLVAVAGGDGTVGKVFRLLADTSLPATLFPAGSANNIARSLGFAGEDPEELIRGLSQARRAWYDVGSMSGERFVESAGGGVFAEVLVRAEEDDRDVGGESKLEFGLRTLRDIVDETPALEWDVEIDGIELRGDFLSVEAMNVRELGPNVPLAPSSDPSDGTLDLALIREDHRHELVAYLDARLADREAEPPTLDVYRARRIVLRPPGAFPVHLDDRLEGREAIADDSGRITVGLDGGLTVLVPAGA